MNDATVITATVGNPLLLENLKSVARQTVPTNHLLLIDGPEHYDKVYAAISLLMRDGIKTDHIAIVNLPYSIGKDRWNGHRIYAAGSYMVDTRYCMFLDDDNSLHPTHIEECVRAIHKLKKAAYGKREEDMWVFSFRNIVDKDGNFVCEDNCESLGKWASVLGENDYFVDVNCFFLPTSLAVRISPFWYRKFREPGQPEVDRVLTHVLRSLPHEPTFRYTVNYTVGNTPNSVKAEFFDRGNELVKKRYDNKLPWKAWSHTELATEI